MKRNASSENCDSSLLLFWVVVGFGGSRVDRPCAMLGSAHVKHLLRDGGLASINVSDNADVSNRRKFASHDLNDGVYGLSPLDCKKLGRRNVTSKSNQA
jgi:hypothetical protein